MGFGPKLAQARNSPCTFCKYFGEKNINIKKNRFIKNKNKNSTAGRYPVFLFFIFIKAILQFLPKNSLAERLYLF